MHAAIGLADIDVPTLVLSSLAISGGSNWHEDHKGDPRYECYSHQDGHRRAWDAGVGGYMCISRRGPLRLDEDHCARPALTDYQLHRSITTAMHVCHEQLPWQVHFRGHKDGCSGGALLLSIALPADPTAHAKRTSRKCLLNWVSLFPARVKVAMTRSVPKHRPLNPKRIMSVMKVTKTKRMQRKRSALMTKSVHSVGA